MAQKFKLKKRLGEGHFATTYLAKVVDPDLVKKYGKDLVVLKVPLKNRESSLENEARETIKKENQLFNLIEKGYERKSTNKYIVQYYDFESYKDNIVIVVEYVPDGNLRNLIGIQEDRKPVDMDVAMKLMQGMLAGTQFLHWKRILHRDLKPENILLCQYEENGKTFFIPKISDFGCSRLLTPKGRAPTPAGSPPYIAPEFFDKGEGSLNWDIWSLGVIFYEMLAGHHPFDYTDAFAGNLPYYQAIYTDETFKRTPLYEVNSAVPKEISEFVDKCLQKEPENRYQTGKMARMAFAEICTWLELLDLKKTSDKDKFIRQAEKFIRKYPLNSRGYELLGCFYSDKREYLKAFAVFEDGIKHCPESGDLYYWAGQNLDQNREADRAIWYYEKAIEKNARRNYLKIAKLRCKRSH
jgi:serine/threonine protein kinase